MPHKTPEAILTLARQFTEARVLLTAVELDLFTTLAEQPADAAQVASACRTTERGIRIILDALVALDLLEKEDGTYRCPPSVAACLSARSPSSVTPMILHSAAMWQRWSALTDTVRHGAPAEQPTPVVREGRDLEAFIGGMHVIGARLAADIVAAIGPGDARKLLDVGGASGTYTEAFLRAAPELRATLFDLPPVVAIARRRLEGTGLLSRIDVVAGDFYADELPGGHDLALLSAIIHQNSHAQNVALYGKIHRALVPGGRLVIRDHVMSADHTRPAAGALFAVNMLAGTPGGDTYSFDEIRDGLAAAGFGSIRLLREDDRMNGLVEAFKER